eukprot:TRINITY_DN30402_c0_g1_i1.p1 TRINITY_DN30402_c0_g1~~TRINITY_DN30402_c0_g1_i1.p1  ORF type:complete len:582 (+),score=99.09 TRINITY_DN30402_c0_g1_i1:97-1746(+)
MSENLAEENKRLRQEIEALKQAQVSQKKEAVLNPNTGALTTTEKERHKFHDGDCLKSSDFQTPRTKAAKDALNYDVTHEFFSAHEKNTALNVQKDIKQSCRIAEDRLEKLEDASTILDKAIDSINSSGDTAIADIHKSFKKYNEQLDTREAQIIRDLQRHKAGEINKIQKEKTVVEQLLSTLDNLVMEAQHVMSGPRCTDEDENDSPEGEYKTLAEIKDEFTHLRQILLPWDVGYLFDMITAKASEQMIGVRATAVHDIISRLVETLATAREKASTTLETLNTFISEVELVVPDTTERIRDEFSMFKKIAAQKESFFLDKVEHYHKNYNERVQIEQEFVDEWISNLQHHQRASLDAVATGNDYQLLKELEILNQTLVHIDGSTLTLGYDTIGFEPCETILEKPIDQLGVLVREEIVISPKFSQAYHYYQFLEHKEFIYGGSETGGKGPPPETGITNKERALFEASFSRIDKFGDGTLDEAELEVMWLEVFSGVPKQAIASITQRIFNEIDTSNKKRIHFEEFMSYISEGMRTNLGAQRDQFYRSGENSI